MAKKEYKEPTFEEVAAMTHTELMRKAHGDGVYAALLTIQLGLKAPKESKNNFAHFNYRTAGQILEKVKPFLDKTGCTLEISDDMVLIGDRYYVHTTVILHHIESDGEIVCSGWAREGLTEKGKMDSQMTGSASTFAKKYALCNLFAIDDSADDPDVTSGADRVSQAVMALNNAQTLDDVNQVKAYYIDVMGDATVMAAGLAAKQRIGY